MSKMAPIVDEEECTDLEQLKKEEESDEDDDEEFNEECEECGAKMSSTKLTEEEFDEHPDREAGYCKHTGNWFCMKCRDFDEAGRYKPYFEEGREKLIDDFKKKYGEDDDEEDEDEAIGNCCEWCEEDTIFFADSHCIDCQNDAASTISKAFKAFKCKKEEEEEESDDPFKGCDECGDWGNGYGISLYQKGKYWYCSGCMEIMDGCTYNFYICRHCFAFGTDNPDCHKCKREMCVLLYQEKNAKLALAKAKQD